MDKTYKRFSQDLQPIFRDLITYSDQLSHWLLKDPEVENHASLLPSLLLWHQTVYPEWVFKRGFNRHLRGGFRYLLVYLDAIIDSFLSMDYHLTYIRPLDFFTDIRNSLAEAISNNKDLLTVVANFLANDPIDLTQHNLTSDVTDLYNSLRSVLPFDLDLLDLSDDYIHVSATVRDVVDVREILLKMITALPIDDLTATE